MPLPYNDPTCIDESIVIKKKSVLDDDRGRTNLNSRRAYEIMHQAQTIAYPHIFQAEGRRIAFDGRSNMYASFDILSGSPGAQVRPFPSDFPLA